MDENIKYYLDWKKQIIAGSGVDNPEMSPIDVFAFLDQFALSIYDSSYSNTDVNKVIKNFRDKQLSEVKKYNEIMKALSTNNQSFISWFMSR